MKRFLITRPQHDLPTSYLYYFSKGIINMVRALKTIRVIDLDGKKANKTTLNSSLSKEKPGLIFLNGHGDKNSVWGHKNEIILDKSNICLTKDSIVYALACDSLEELGKLAINEGTRAYIGYRARFMCAKDPSRAGTPEKDNNALPFKRANFALIDSLLSSEPVYKAISRTKQEYLHSIKSYGTSEDDPYGDAPIIRFALTWDLEFLDFEGDPDAAF